MKKSLLALAVLGAFAGAAQAQSSVTIYGLIDTGVSYVNKGASSVAGGNVTTGSKFSVNSGTINGSRLGFKGSEDLGGGLKAVFQLEAGFNNDDGTTQSPYSGTTTLFRRKSVVGFSSTSFGDILLGRQTDVTDDYAAYSSVNTFGNWVSNVGMGLNRAEGTRVVNSLRYNTLDYSGFSASAIYGFGETANKTSAGQSFGLGAKYANGPLALYAAYFQSKAGSTNANASDTGIDAATAGVANANSGKTAFKSWTLGASYLVGPARVYGNWSRVRQGLATSAGPNQVPAVAPTAFIIGGSNNSKADIYDLGVDYALTAPLHLLASVQHSRLDFVGTSTKGKLTQGNLGLDYYLSKRTDLYSFVSYLKAKDTFNPGVGVASAGAIGTGGDNGQAAVTVGIRHRF